MLGVSRARSPWPPAHAARLVLDGRCSRINREADKRERRCQVASARRPPRAMPRGACRDLENDLRAARIGKLSKADQKSSCVCLYDRHESGSTSPDDWPPQILEAILCQSARIRRVGHGYFPRQYRSRTGFQWCIISHRTSRYASLWSFATTSKVDRRVSGSPVALSEPSD
jgi:hypothetical protein